MRTYKAKTSISLLFIALAALVTGLTMPGQTQDRSRGQNEPVFKGRELPVVDFDEPEPVEPVARAKRRAKGQRYDKNTSQPIGEELSIAGRVWSNHWARGLSALPVNASDLIVIGNVTEAKAHLSNDKTGIYSDFALAIQQVLKNGTKSVSPGNSISVQRFGGAVRFQSGRVLRYETRGQGTPVVGRTYLLFLKHLDGEADYSIVTGYDLSGPTVLPLDGAVADESNEKYPFDNYRGFDLSDFLNKVRTLASQTLCSMNSTPRSVIGRIAANTSSPEQFAT